MIYPHLNIGALAFQNTDIRNMEMDDKTQRRATNYETLRSESPI